MSTAKEMLLLANSTEEQKKWVSRLLKRVPRKPSTHYPFPSAVASPRSVFTQTFTPSSRQSALYTTAALQQEQLTLVKAG
ncbi:rho-associated protein kinase 2-like [Danio rerio]|uniref:Rho-associated protein kinase 2-like isoform X4 n=2 Tax=Danio rerio TaxID=7955 RepID=A0AC58I5M5_DANRE